ncbi:c-type cytochrome [Sinimarinibacterium flocculans]|uniref:Cytochrome c5 n=1 Tax=Sinimarinibacterium flocculans TaxID=985250 RepID=A0A318E044_9GAMM|nr:c-type cytochrome [Sinimarinibacterium flocculans]MEC9363400.1 c-type cytochrome [Pseudomonadota bacterium]PXV63625.1 cytochrome c5 [Sinimarinibacterium flocculans]
MDHKDHDKVFFANFGVVMAALFGIFFICIIAASMISSEEEPDPAAIALVEERIRPVAKAVTDPDALIKVSAAAAQREPLSGAQLNTQLCAGCHSAGVLGAPKTGDGAAWAQRRDAAGGIDGLVSAVINGKGAMPPKAGDPSLSEDEIRGAVEFMLKEAGI